MAVVRRSNNEKFSQQRWGASNWRNLGSILGTAAAGAGLGYLAYKHPKLIQKALHGLGGAVQSLSGKGDPVEKGVGLANKVLGGVLPFGANINTGAVKKLFGQ